MSEFYCLDIEFPDVDFNKYSYQHKTEINPNRSRLSDSINDDEKGNKGEN